MCFILQAWNSSCHHWKKPSFFQHKGLNSSTTRLSQRNKRIQKEQSNNHFNVQTAVTAVSWDIGVIGVIAVIATQLRATGWSYFAFWYVHGNHYSTKAMVLLDVSFWSKHFNPKMWNYISNWNHLSVDVLGTSDIAFHEIWFVLLLHKHPAIVNLLIRECQYTFFVLRCTAHCSRKNIPTPINNPYAQAISDTMRKDSRQRKERSTKIWHQHRGPADQALPSTLDDFQPCPMNSWCSQWSSSSSAEFSKTAFRSPIPGQFDVSSCGHLVSFLEILLSFWLLPAKFLAFWAGRGWVHLQNVAHIDTSTGKWQKFWTAKRTSYLIITD